MHSPVKLILVAGARPNFIKAAALFRALDERRREFSVRLVHTGQHYGTEMSDVFFRELGLPEPDVHLGVGSGTHARQTADVMVGFEPVLIEDPPDAVIVVGDVNSTVACALVAAKLGVKIAHVEAGLRSFDRRMPEEVNRMITDTVSDMLFVSEPSGVENLRREGVPEERIHFVGNVMIDTLVRCRSSLARSTGGEALGLRRREYALLTLHRPSNVDDSENLRSIIEAVRAISRRIPVIFPAHPRTVERFDSLDLRRELDGAAIRLVPPMGYLDFLKLQADAALVLTDSGGVQEETTFLGVPCLTVRENTERPITVTRGTNVITGTDTSAIIGEAERVLRGAAKTASSPPDLWDGRAAERIVSILARELGGAGEPGTRHDAGTGEARGAAGG